jgi:hypothetical protein
VAGGSTTPKGTPPDPLAPRDPRGGAKFNTGRFLVALGIFLLLLAGGITTDALKLTNSYPTLFALSATIFGFLGGEKS